MFKKGNIVLVKGFVHTNYVGDDKKLFHWPCHKPWKGMVVGNSVLYTGRYQALYPDERGTLEQRKTQHVVMVIPLNTNQWVEPWRCLEEDLTKEGSDATT